MDVGGVPEEKRTPLAKAVCNPMVDAIGREPAHASHVDVHPPDHAPAHVFPRQILWLLLRDVAHRTDKPCAPLALQRKDGKEISLVEADMYLAIYGYTSRFHVGHVQQVRIVPT